MVLQVKLEAIHLILDKKKKGLLLAIMSPAHMHVDSELIKSVKFVKEEKPERISLCTIL